MHAGGWSLFRFQTSRARVLEITEALRSTWNAWAQSAIMLNLKSENFGENLKIHVGGDDKQQSQFALPYKAELPDKSSSLWVCIKKFDPGHSFW